jgi:F-type H+-transporting ATPase subunit b
MEALGIYWNKLIAQAICFGIVFWVLKRFAYKPILDLLEKRRKTIAQGLENAEKIKQELARAELQVKDVLSKANDKASFIMNEAQKSATALVEKKMQDAVHEAEAVVKKAEEAMRVEREKMMGEIKKEVAQLVVATSVKVTGKILTPEDHQRLNREVVEELRA